MYVPPHEVVEQATAIGAKKAALSTKDMAVRGFLSASLLGYATALAVYASAQTNSPLVGALIFPVGFVMLSLLGLELVTGNFALLLLPAFQRQIGAGQILRNWVVVYLAHIVGGLFLAYLVYVAWTTGGTHLGDPWVKRLTAITESKTLAYAQMGGQVIVGRLRQSGSVQLDGDPCLWASKRQMGRNLPWMHSWRLFRGRWPWRGDVAGNQILCAVGTSRGLGAVEPRAAASRRADDGWRRAVPVA
jgi:hypothetical protein